MMLKLKLQYFGHLMPRVDSLDKTLMLAGIGGRRRRGRQRMRWLDGITGLMDVFEWTLGVGDGQGGLVCCNSWGRKESDTTEWLNWTESKKKKKLGIFRPAHCSLYPLCSQKRERIKNSFLSFSFACILSHFSRVKHFVTSMACSPPGSSVHGILQARRLEWVAFPFSRGSSLLRDWTCISCIGRQILYWLSHQWSPFFPSLCNKFNQVIHRQENENRMVHLYTAKLPSPESEQNNANDNSVDG